MSGCMQTVLVFFQLDMWKSVFSRLETAYNELFHEKLICLGKGSKKCEKVWSFAQPPSDPPWFGHFSDEKIDPQFFF